MKFTIRGWNPEENKIDETVTTIDTWYDRHQRVWVVQKKNKDGDQIGDATFFANKKNAMEEADDLRKELGI